MLNPKPKERITAAEVLNHPWVREDGDAGTAKLDNIVLTRMKNFANINKFKKMGLMAMAKTLTNEELMGLKVRPARHCSPRHPTHFEPSFLGLNHCI